MKASKNNKTNSYIVFALFLVLIYIVIQTFSSPSSSSLNLVGTPGEIYELKAEDAELTFEAESIIIRSSEITAKYVTKIIVRDNSGDEHPYFNPTANFIFNDDENSDLFVQNPKLNLYLVDDVYLKQGFGYLRGECSNHKEYGVSVENSNSINIWPDDIDSAIINGDEIEDFELIIIDLKNSGYLTLSPGNISFFATDISKYNLKSNSITSLHLDDSNSLLNLDGNVYPISNINSVDLEFHSDYHSVILIENNSLYSDGYLTSAKIDRNNIMKTTVLYWFDQKPEKIAAFAAFASAIASVLLVIVTIHYAFSTHKILDMSAKNNQMEYTEKSLKYLYYPLIAFIRNHSVVDDDIVRFTSHNKNDLSDLDTYSYLSRKESYKCIRQFIDIFYNFQPILSINDYEILVNTVTADIDYNRCLLAQLVDG